MCADLYDINDICLGKHFCDQKNKMSDLVRNNLEESENVGTLLIQVIMLILMGMFASVHVVISFVWGGLLSLLLGVEWLPTAMHYLQSWEFSRLSVGVPFSIFLFSFIHIYLVVKSKSLPPVIDAKTMQAIVGDKGTVKELRADHPCYSDMLKMAKKAGMATPRLFGCFGTGNVNAWTITDHSGGSGILIYEPLLITMTRRDLQSVIGHELGHLMGKDTRRKVVLMALVVTLESILGKGLELCLNESGEVFHKRPDLPMVVAIMTSVLVFIFGLAMITLGFFPWLWSRGLVWWREYHDEYHADARGAWLTGDPQGMADALIVLHWIGETGGRVNGYGVFQVIRSAMRGEQRDVHPPSEFRVRKWMPHFNGDWDAAYRDVMRRRGLSV